MFLRQILCLIAGAVLLSPAYAQDNFAGRRFEQLGTLLPTPNSYRTASGAPGHEYWQQKVDYQIRVELRESDQTIHGSELITYHNNSPDPLRYFWLQLDQNMRHPESDTYSSAVSEIKEGMSARQLRSIIGHGMDLGYKILEVTNAEGMPLPYVINKTMMRVELPDELRRGESFSLKVRWYYNINDRSKVGGRSGMELFEDGNYLFSIAQFFPRLAVYDDVNGWQNKQFLGNGEFTLPFGDYEVHITVPEDHIVASTGALQNAEQVLTAKQRQLLEQAARADQPVLIVDQSEAIQKEKKRTMGTSTWIYRAENVRDFAFASSRKFIWDAMGVEIGGRTVMAMSYYPKEANPLYGEYSTRVIAHTLRFYSDYTIDYPYPVAISVEASNGMEYPMISFNYGRPNRDGTYSERLKNGMISVIIHEVGHNFFPMIINSDERQWTWMDEGLNSFVQQLAEKAWDPDYPSRRGRPESIVPYMKGSKEGMVPVMTNSEQLKQFGSNGYAKPATALYILRETVMGPELFDYAFKEYCRRWAFRHPSPADFFRSMEDASAVDLDWFWRGWFFTTDHVDIELADVTWYKHDVQITNREGRKRQVEAEGGAAGPREHGYTQVADSPGDKLNQPLSLGVLLSEGDHLLSQDMNFYELRLRNIGGLVMPVIIQFNYRDGSSEVKRVPAEIWRRNETEVTKVFVLEKEVESVQLDPFRETADVDEVNNHFPPRELPSRFDNYTR